MTTVRAVMVRRALLFGGHRGRRARLMVTRPVSRVMRVGVVLMMVMVVVRVVVMLVALTVMALLRVTAAVPTTGRR